MKYPVALRGKSEALFLERLTEAYLDAAVELCNQSVGENLYSRDYLASLIENPTHSFYIVVTPEKKLAGYIYFFVTNLEEMASLAKLQHNQLAGLFEKESPIIGNLCSIGVAEAYRHNRLSVELIRFGLKRLETDWSVDATFGVGWKINGYVPIEKTLMACNFRYLIDSHRVWYDNEALICPYCKGRCECDAAVYYKPAGKETIT